MVKIEDVSGIAILFVDFALSRKSSEWPQVKELSVRQASHLSTFVAAAGFKPEMVVPGMLKGDYLDQDGSKTGKTFPINMLCPFKVIDQDKQDDFFATGWLDCAFRFALQKFKEGRERKEIYQAIQQAIERSVPLEPIRLTSEGDFLCEYPRRPSDMSSFPFFVNHSRDDHPLDSCAGVHKYCQGFLDRLSVTRDHDALVCKKCNLRVTFPKNAKTYGELRQALKVKLAPAPVYPGV